MDSIFNNKPIPGGWTGTSAPARQALPAGSAYGADSQGRTFVFRDSGGKISVDDMNGNFVGSWARWEFEAGKVPQDRVPTSAWREGLDNLRKPNGGSGIAGL